MATTPNYSWVMPDSTDLVKDLPADFATFGNAVDSTVKSNADAAVTKATFTTKGDILQTTAASTVSRLAIGTDGQVLTADSASSGGMKWATASSGGITLISETTASAISSLSLSSIPSTYKDLVLTWDEIYHSSSGNKFDIRLNNDSGTNYYISAGGISGNYSYGNPTSILNGSATAYFAFGKDVNHTDPFNCRGILRIFNYASTSKTKFFEVHTGYYDLAASDPQAVHGVGTYSSTSAISSIDVVRIAGTGTFSNRSNNSIRLYGVS